MCSIRLAVNILQKSTSSIDFQKLFHSVLDHGDCPAVNCKLRVQHSTNGTCSAVVPVVVYGLGQDFCLAYVGWQWKRRGKGSKRRQEGTFKGAITSKIKHAIKLKTSPARLAQLLQPSLACCFSLQPMIVHRPVRRHWLQAKTKC